MSKSHERNGVDEQTLPEEFGAYRFVLDHVLENVKREFEQEGVDESVLLDLQKRWEAKLISSGALSLEPVENRPEDANESGSKKRKQEGADPADQEQASKKQKAEEDPEADDDEEELDKLNNQIDDDDPDTGGNLVLAHFEKVNRTKSRWRCTLKQGIMNIEGRDKLFLKASGDFQF